MAHVHVKNSYQAAESDLIRRAMRKDEAAIRAIIQANNRRLYRAARSILRDDAEAEDVVQEAYLRAFAALSEFRGESSLATWLTRIVVNEALQRKRKPSEFPVAGFDELRQPAQVIPFPLSANQPVDPERAVAQREIFELLEKAIDDLPDEFRTVLVARAVEGLSVDETADLLGIRPETVKTRLHRARRLLRTALAGHIGMLFSDVFPFDGARCQRMTNTVVARLNLPA